MYNRFLIYLSAILWMAPLGLQAQSSSTFSPGKAHYLWPTNASPYLSSTFAETRAGHFHAALDLKTWGRRGYKVFATRDGILHRIAIGPTGYGKVVYLKHKDGSYSVYAHLLRFRKDIQQLADSIRFRDYSFEIDTVLDSKNIRIKQGEVIGLSGASGIGPPHLHFELRTPDEEPFNPLLTNLSIEDHRPPRFSYLSVEPLSIHSRIENKNAIYTKRGWQSQGEHSFGIIDVSGPVGLGVVTFDQADKVHNAYAVHELEMRVDGKLHFSSRVDKFSYEETGQMFLDRVYPILQQTGSAYQRLFIVDGNTLPFYQPTPESGRLDLAPGDHAVTITARDYNGNVSTAHLTLRVHPTKEVVYTDFTTENEEKVKHPLRSFDPESWEWFKDWVNIPNSNARGLTIIPLTQFDKVRTGIQNQHEASVDLTTSRDLFFRQSPTSYLIARRVYPGKFSIIPSSDNSFAAFEKGTVYDTLSAGLRVHTITPDSVRIDLIPSNQPLQKTFRLSVSVDSTQKHIPNWSLYQYDARKNRFSYLPAHLTGDYLTAYPDAFGTYFLLSDTTAPRLSNPKVTKQPDGQWIAAVTATDNLSGIDYKRCTFYINGVRGIAEFEPEDDRLVYYYPGFQPTGEDILEVTAYDQEGNYTQQIFDLSPSDSSATK